MARNPFLPGYAKCSYGIGSFSIEKHPEFARLIGQCTAVWSYVDNEMGTLFGLLLDTQLTAALEVFLSLRKSANQIEALKAAAKYRLTGDVGDAFSALIANYKSLEGDRNDLAHGCFGTIDGLDDHILWIEVKHHVHFMADAITKEARGEFGADRHQLLKENLYVYKLSDIQRIYDQMKEFWWAAFHLNCYLRRPDTQTGAQQFRDLCALPQIERELRLIRAGRETSP